jgi:soluble P-type ATPase
MRKDGDNRNDTVVKREILEELIKTRYIVAALDDRNRVVKMWRESGIKCLQVQEGNF